MQTWVLASYCVVTWLRLNNLDDALRLIELTGLVVVRPSVRQRPPRPNTRRTGCLTEAAALPRDAVPTGTLPPLGVFHFPLYAKAQLLNAQGYRLRLANGSQHSADGNPAIVAWRSEAALSLHALARDEEAREYAIEELELVRNWGAPYVLGRALRVTGLRMPGPAGLDLRHDALDVLAPIYRPPRARQGSRRSRRGPTPRQLPDAGPSHGRPRPAYRCGAAPLFRSRARRTAGRPDARPSPDRTR